LRIRIALLWGGLLAAWAVSAADEFKCPTGAKDSGYKPGNVVRWCEIQKEGRLLYHGPVWRWHRNGQPETRMNYINGNADGDTPSWYANGKPSSRGHFSNGSKVGLWKYWDDKGALTTEVTYRENGHQRVDYYPDGKKKATGLFKSSGKIGQWTYWEPSGKEKARCDFGEGAFAAASEPCQVIADELDPKGFSKPMPVGSVLSDAATVRLGKQQYRFKGPGGWTADASAGREEGAPLVLYRKGGKWRGDGPNIYVRPLFKDGASFDEVVSQEAQGFGESVSGYKEGATAKETLPSGMAMVSRIISYSPLIETDSPFAIVANNTVNEHVAFVDASPEFAFMVVLTSPTEKDFKESGGAFGAFAHSVAKAAE
jgi:hypothetical protein